MRVVLVEVDRAAVRHLEDALAAVFSDALRRRRGAGRRRVRRRRDVLERPRHEPELDPRRWHLRAKVAAVRALVRRAVALKRHVVFLDLKELTRDLEILFGAFGGVAIRVLAGQKRTTGGTDRRKWIVFRLFRLFRSSARRFGRFGRGGGGGAGGGAGFGVASVASLAALAVAPRAAAPAAPAASAASAAATAGGRGAAALLAGFTGAAAVDDAATPRPRDRPTAGAGYSAAGLARGRRGSLDGEPAARAVRGDGRGARERREAREVRREARGVRRESCGGGPRDRGGATLPRRRATRPPPRRKSREVGARGDDRRARRRGARARRRARG